MSSEEYKKAFLFLSNKCSKKEISSREALVLSAKFHLKMVEKNNLINELKKKEFINHLRYAKAFVHDKFIFYKWGKVKIIHHLRQKGIEEALINEAIEEINQKQYLIVLKEEAQKKHLSMNTPKDFKSKQKILKFLSQKGFETELVITEVSKIFD